MFTNNQILNISGTVDKLAFAVDFAMHMAGRMNDIAWQTAGNMFVLGHTGGRKVEGWTQYNHSTSTKKIAKDILVFLREHRGDHPLGREGDIYWEEGFLMSIPDDNGEKCRKIMNPEYALVVFEPYDCYYKM